MREHTHSESFCPLGDRASQRTESDDADGGAGNVADRVGEKAELPGRVPDARPHVVHVRNEAAAQSEHQRQHMLGHGVLRIATDVGDRNALRLRGLDIDRIGACRRDGDQAQVRQLRKHACINADLVDDGDCRALEAFDDLVRLGDLVFHVLMWKGQLSQAGPQCFPVEKYDAFHA